MNKCHTCQYNACTGSDIIAKFSPQKGDNGSKLVVSKSI